MGKEEKGEYEKKKEKSEIRCGQTAQKGVDDVGLTGIGLLLCILCVWMNAKCFKKVVRISKKDTAPLVEQDINFCSLCFCQRLGCVWSCLYV